MIANVSSLPVAMVVSGAAQGEGTGMMANVSSLPVAMVVSGAAQGEGTGSEAPTLGADDS